MQSRRQVMNTNFLCTSVHGLLSLIPFGLPSFLASPFDCWWLARVQMVRCSIPIQMGGRCSAQSKIGRALLRPIQNITNCLDAHTVHLASNPAFCLTVTKLVPSIFITFHPLITDFGQTNHFHPAQFAPILFALQLFLSDERLFCHEFERRQFLAVYTEVRGPTQ